MGLKAGDDTIFQHKECLFIPELSQNLIAGGVLIQKGVTICVNQNNSSCFSLVLNNKALFNGLFLSKNLMLVEIIPVSEVSSTNHCKANGLRDDSGVLHRRLGHLIDRYLKMMCKKECAEDIKGIEVKGYDCKVCSISKATKLPHTPTRPRAIHHFGNFHVDLSGIIREKGLHREM